MRIIQNSSDLWILSVFGHILTTAMRVSKPRSQSFCHPCIIWMWIFPQWNPTKDSTVHESAGWDLFSREPGWLWEKGWKLTTAENIFHHHPPTDGGARKLVVTSETDKRWFSTKKTEESLNEYNQVLNYHWKQKFFLQKSDLGVTIKKLL